MIKHKDVVSANREMYDRLGPTYDVDNDSVYLNKRIAWLLNKASNNYWEKFALDCCCGTGRMTEHLLRRGAKVIAIDISNILIKQAEKRCSKYINYVEFLNQDVLTYLKNTSSRFDIITFCSALHHFLKPEEVLESAIKCLKPNGKIITIFDPFLNKSNTFIKKAISKIDYCLFTCGLNPLKYINKCLSIVFRKQKNNTLSAEIIKLAEYHAEDGIDIHLLIKVIDRQNCKYDFSFWGGSYAPFGEFLFSLFNIKRYFDLIVYKEVSEYV